MNSVSIYSNLSLQILKLKDVDFLYDEYFNFDLNMDSDISIFVIMQTIKPVLDNDIFLELVEKNINVGKRVVIISEDTRFFRNILLTKLSEIELFEFPKEVLHDDHISIRNLYRFQFPFSKKSASILRFFVQNIIQSLSSPKVKAICLDFDNTLWQGIIGDENNFMNLFERSGSPFLLFQNKLKELKSHGILLCLVTKNNRSDLDLFFASNKSMPLNLTDFVIVKSNWATKSSNIIAIRNELGISSDTFLYFDDSDFELEEVRVKLPEVRSHKVSISSMTNLMSLVPEFQEIISRGKIIDKTAQYQKEFKRKKLLVESDYSVDPYNFASFDRLEVKLEIVCHGLDLERISEMSEKTNQFNFNKTALSVSHLNELLKRDHMFYTCSARDKYGDYGIVGYIHLDANLKCENFVISCRALSRGIEFKFVEHVRRELKLKELVLKFKSTDRNNPVKLFLQNSQKLPYTVITL